MIEKIIRFSVSVIFVLSFSLGLDSGVYCGVYAQEKKVPKKTEKHAPEPAKEKSTKPKPETQKKDTISFENKEFPDGLIGRRYNFVLTPVSATPPYKVTIVSGTLPPGITLNNQTGGIEGEPNQTGVWNVALRVVDAKGERGTFSGDIRVWRALTVGEHGTFKDFDGLQMALNMAKDMDEIRIEKGVIRGSGLVIPANKAWEHGIKISGGWNETFTEERDAKKIEVAEIGIDYISETGRDYSSLHIPIDEDPEATILDGGFNGNRIFTILNSSGGILIENIRFINSRGGAVKINRGVQVKFTNCTFINNRSNDGGAAVNGNGIFMNCDFINNASKDNGGAVSGGGDFTNCTFKFNSVTWSNSLGEGGAVSGGGRFTNCIFISNSAKGYWGDGAGGAVSGGGTFVKCSFIDNKTGGKYGYGGAVSGGGTFKDCIFRGNSTNGELHNKGGGAVAGDGTFINCIFTNNSANNRGGAVDGNGDFRNCEFADNSASYGGAVSGTGNFTNCTFTNNRANDGGAVYGKDGNTIFTNTTFVNNKADNGGAIWGNDMDIKNSVFHKNEATNSGGALKLNGESIIFNTTFAENIAGSTGGAIRGQGIIINSIFYVNKIGQKDNDITVGGNMKIDYSIINQIQGAFDYGDHNIMGDPKLLDPDNGDLRLRPDSPAINSGKMVPELKDISTDLDGKLRIYGGKIDMGAYEWQGQQ